MRAGADTTAQNASERKLEKIIWMLIEDFADIKAKDHDGLPAVDKEWLMELWGSLRRPPMGLNADKIS